MDVSKKLLPLLFLVGVGFFAAALYFSLFPSLFLRTDYFAENAWVERFPHLMLGLAVGLSSFGQIFGAKFIAVLSNRLGRKPVLLVASLGIFLGYLMIALAVQERVLWLLFLGTFFSGLCNANIAMAQTVIADLTVRHHRQQLFGRVYFTRSLGLFLGGIVGGWLGTIDISVPFWILVILSAIVVLALRFGFEESGGRHPEQRFKIKEVLEGAAFIFTQRELRGRYLVNLFVYLALYGLLSAVPIYLVAHFHVTRFLNGVFFAYISLVAGLAIWALNPILARRFLPKNVLKWLLPVTGIFMIALVLPADLDGVWPILLVASIGYGLCFPTSASMISHAAHDLDADQAIALGANQGLKVVSLTITSVLSALLTGINVNIPLAIWGICAIVAAIILFVQRFVLRIDRLKS